MTRVPGMTGMKRMTRMARMTEIDLDARNDWNDKDEGND